MGFSKNEILRQKAYLTIYLASRHFHRSALCSNWKSPSHLEALDKVSRLLGMLAELSFTITRSDKY